MVYDRRAATPVFRLDFDGTEFAGMAYRIREPGFEALLASALVARVEARGLPMPVWLAEMSKLVDEFAESLVDWELVDDGRPVPCTPREVRRLDVPFLTALIKAWAHTIGAAHTAPVAPVPAGPAPFDETQLAELMQPLDHAATEPVHEPVAATA